LRGVDRELGSSSNVSIEGLARRRTRRSRAWLVVERVDRSEQAVDRLPASKLYVAGTPGSPMDVIPEESEDSTEAVEGVHLTVLAGGENANLQQFVIEPGATVPEHSHPPEQLGIVVEGTLTFVVDSGPPETSRVNGDAVNGAEHQVGEGDTYHLAGGEAHAAENRGDVPVVGYDVFSPPRDDPDWRD
jgi:quercetin dioxygenase-like cupin family protein